MAIATKRRDSATLKRPITKNTPDGGSVSGHAPPARRSVRRTRAKEAEDQKTAMLHVRVDETLKANATAIFDEIGISLSEALRVFLTRVVSEKAFPFQLEVPNARTRAAMIEGRKLGRRFATAQELFDDLEKGGRD